LPVNVSIAGKEPVAVKGVLDLREYKPGDRIKVNLNGEWEFYWNRFLYPSDFTTSEKRPQPDIYGKVPAYWTSYSGEIPVNKYGYAAYRLVILLPENTETSYAFDIPVFDSSFELWVNDSLLYSNGKPGTTSETTIPEYRPGLRVYNSSSDTLSILINVANFHHRRGGFWQTMVFGTYKDVQKSVASKLAADYITVGILGSFALFFMLFFLLYPRDKILLIYSLTLLFLAIRPFFTSEYLIYDYADVSWSWTIRYEYLCSFLALGGWAWYNYYLYPSKNNKAFSQSLTVLFVASIIAILATSVKVFSYSVFILYIGIVSLVAHALISSFKGILKKNITDAFYFILFLIISFGALHDIFVSAGMTKSSFGYLMPFLMVIFLFAQSVLLLSKWIKAFYEKERLQAELEKINRNLENIVAERTRELTLRTKEIEKKNLMIESQNLRLTEIINFKNKIFSVIAHDLRSPVVNILYILNLLKEKEFKDKYEEFADSSIKYAQMVIALLENMLVWGRGQEDKIKYSPGMHDLAMMIQTNTSIFKETANRKKISISFNQEGNSMAYCDKDLIDIVIRNLLSNAIKYSYPGGTVSVLVKENKNENTLSVKVCDNGTGIPEEHLKNLFNPTEIISTPGTDNEKGTGIGLKLCHELMLINKGHISAESHEGSGSCFQIVLPSSPVLQ